MDEVGNIYRTVEFGGWDLHSFINQNGTIAENGQAVTIPVTASPITTVTTAPGLPKQVRVMQEWGQFNFLTANGGADAPGTAGSGGVQLWYGNGPTQSPATSVNQKTRTTTLWLGNYSLQPSRVERTLLGTELPNLRPGATAPLAIQTTNYYYDAKGRLTGTTTQLGTGFSQEARAYSGNNPQPDTVTQWAGLGSDLAHAVPLNFAGLAGKSYTYSPGPNFWLRTETDLLKGTTTYERDNLGRVTKTTDPNGVETTTTYDSWGRVYEVTRKAIGGIGPVTRRYTYEPNGLWTKTEVMAEGKTLASKTYLDAFGRVWKEEAADGGVRTTQYDGYGQKIAQSPWLRPGQTPYGNYTFTYDKKGRLVASKDPQGRTLSTAPADPAWDATAGGGITTTFDDRNYTRSSVTDLLGQQKSLTDPKGQTTTFTYDRFGRMNRMSLAGQNRVYAYDDLGHLVSRMEPEEGETVYGDYTVWGAPGRVQQKGLSGTSPVAILTNFDAKGRPNQVWDDQGNTFLRTIKYDPDYPDRVSQIEEYQADGSMQETYGYDAMGRLVQKTIVDDYRQEFSMSRTFDAMGNVTRLYYPVFGIVNFGYDAYFRPSTITKPGSQPVPVASMTYDQVDGTKVDSTLTFGNNATTVRSFDKGELTRITHTAVGLNDVNPMTWTAGGLLLSRGNDVFNYDELGCQPTKLLTPLPSEVLTPR
jgi:YD repeat-containing protein